MNDHCDYIQESYCSRNERPKITELEMKKCPRSNGMTIFNFLKNNRQKVSNNVSIDLFITPHNTHTELKEIHQRETF